MAKAESEVGSVTPVDPDEGAAPPVFGVEMVPLDTLIPYAMNARTHSDTQVAEIAASLHKFGWMIPVLIDERNEIIAGHGRTLAARRLREAKSSIRDHDDLHMVPCRRVAGLTNAEIRAYRIADNKLAMNAGWDWGMLTVELEELRDLGINGSSLGFSSKELAELLGDPIDGEKAENITVGGDRFVLQVEMDTETALADLFTELQNRGLACKILT
jgi:ParB family transcriptional regulator, chromosome partitioning protein